MPIDLDDIQTATEGNILDSVALRSASLSAALLDIPNLTAAWIPAYSYRTTGATAQQLDLMGGHDLTLNAAPAIALTQAGKLYEAAGWNLVRASGMFLNRAHETALALTNNFSFGIWINPTTLPGAGEIYGVIGKGTDALANRAWLVFFGILGIANFRVYNGAGANTDVFPAVTMAAGNWYFIQCRFQGGAEMAIFANGVKASNTTSIPSTVRDTASEFSIGRMDAANYFNGKTGIAYLSRSALSDKTMIAIYNKTRVFYGV